MASRDRRDAAGEQTRDPEKLLEIAFNNSEDLLVELDDMKMSIRQDGQCSATEAKRLLSQVTKSIQTVYDERKRLDDLASKNDPESVGGGPDFDALRAEIRSRLDKLRAAAETGSVSEDA